VTRFYPKLPNFVNFVSPFLSSKRVKTEMSRLVRRLITASPMDNKLQRGAVSHVAFFNFRPLPVFGTNKEVMRLKFGTWTVLRRCQSIHEKLFQKERGQGHKLSFCFSQTTWNKRNNSEKWKTGNSHNEILTENHKHLIEWRCYKWQSDRKAF